jgi:flagellin
VSRTPVGKIKGKGFPFNSRRIKMRINNNISAMNTYRQYSSNSVASSKSMEKLSSGSRINRAADDAAGLSISEKMRSQIRGLSQANRNAQDGISLLQTAEGALTEVSDMLTRLKELAVQVQNGTYSDDDKANIGAEMSALGKAISDIYVNTKFNGIAVFGEQAMAEETSGVDVSTIENAFRTSAKNGGLTDNFIKVASGKIQVCDTYGGTYEDATTQPTVAIQGFEDGKVYKYDADGFYEFTGESTKGAKVNFNAIPATYKNALDSQNGNGQAAVIAYGEDAGQYVTVMQAKTTNLSALTALTDAAGKGDTAAAKAASAKLVTVAAVEAAITEVNTTRAAYGAQQNQLEHASNNMATTKENLQAAESRVRDVDMAEEMMEYTKNNILLQAAQAMLAQANSQPQGVLQLLQ